MLALLFSHRFCLLMLHIRICFSYSRAIGSLREAKPHRALPFHLVVLPKRQLGPSVVFGKSPARSERIAPRHSIHFPFRGSESRDRPVPPLLVRCAGRAHLKPPRPFPNRAVPSADATVRLVRACPMSVDDDRAFDLRETLKHSHQTLRLAPSFQAVTLAEPTPSRVTSSDPRRSLAGSDRRGPVARTRLIERITAARAAKACWRGSEYSDANAPARSASGAGRVPIASTASRARSRAG